MTKRWFKTRISLVDKSDGIYEFPAKGSIHQVQTKSIITESVMTCPGQIVPVLLYHQLSREIRQAVKTFQVNSSLEDGSGINFEVKWKYTSLKIKKKIFNSKTGFIED